MAFDPSRPIYRQIISGYLKKMIRGDLRRGDKIPSQREYAEIAKVNPNTVQRAYREMEQQDIVETVRGQGTFVKISDQSLERSKTEMAREYVRHYLLEMRELGFDDQEIISRLVSEITAEGGKPRD
ncbi:MAG TPA: GntR family transcriptional regulator [Syntrophomonas sp.]|nr:GntR family transcriptional regulator [Syntrophomonas sp.]